MSQRKKDSSIVNPGKTDLVLDTDESIGDIFLLVIFLIDILEFDFGTVRFSAALECRMTLYLGICSDMKCLIRKAIQRNMASLFST